MRRLSKRFSRSSAAAQQSADEAPTSVPEKDAEEPGAASAMASPNSTFEEDRVSALLQEWIQQSGISDEERARRRAAADDFLKYSVETDESSVPVDEHALIREKLEQVPGLGQHAELLASHGISTLDKLKSLTDTDLANMGMGFMDRFRLVGAAKDWSALPRIDLSMEELSALPSGPLRVAAHLDVGTSRLVDFPEDYDVRGALRVSFSNQLRALPGGLRVGGSLEAERCLRLRDVGDDLRVGGSLVLRRCEALERMPASMEVLGDITLSHCKALVALPANLHVRGGLNLKRCEQLETLPPGLVVDGTLSLRYTKVRAIPADAKINGTLDIADCDDFQLAEGFEIGGSLLLDEWTFREMPPGLKIGKDLDLEILSLKRLPPVSVGGTLRLGSSLQEMAGPLRVGKLLVLAQCSAALPEGTEVEGSMEMSGCHARRSVRGLRVGAMLTVQNCSRLEQVDDIVVGGALVVRGCAVLTSLGAGVRVGRDVKVENCRKLASLPDDWTVRALDVRGAELPELPRGLRVEGSLHVSGTKLATLPADLHVGDSLTLEQCPLEALPETMQLVRGSLKISSNKLLRLPPRLRVNGTLDLSSCAALEELQSDLRVGKDIVVANCRALKRLLPDGFHALGSVNATSCGALEALGRGVRVERDLTLHKCGALASLDDVDVGNSLIANDCPALQSVGDGVVVGMDFNLAGCTALTRLPRAVRTAGSFSLKGCTMVTALPARLEVGWDLILSGTRVEALPEGGRVRGDLVAEGLLNVRELPRGLKVDGHIGMRGCTQLAEVNMPWDNIYSMDLTGTKVTALPRRLHIKGDLYLGNTDIEALPEDLRVEGELSITGCRKLRALPAGLRVGKSLLANQCDLLVTLPSNLFVQGDLFLADAVALQELPERLEVAGTLECSGCSALWSMGGSLRVGTSAHFNMCVSLTSIPADLYVGRDLELFGCASLSAVPGGMFVGGNLRLTECISVSDLPQEVLDWPLTATGARHVIDLTGSGIFDEELAACRDRAGPGVDLQVSRPNASPVRNFNRLRDAVQFWLDKANLTVEDLAERERERVAEAAEAEAEADAVAREEAAAARSEHSAAADEDDDDDADAADQEDEPDAEPAAAATSEGTQQDDADDEAEAEAAVTVLDLDSVVPRANLRGTLLFLSKLTGAKEFQKEDMRVSLAKRVVEVIELLVHEPDARDELLTRMADSVDACNDKPIQALNQMTLIVRTAKARGNRSALRKLALGIARLQVVQAHAQAKIDSFRRPVDEVVIFLRFEVALAQDLDLPVSALDMLFPNFVLVTDEEMEAARREALSVTPESDSFAEWLAQWSEWQRQDRLEAAKRMSFARLKRNSRKFSLSWTDLFGSPMTDPVRIGKAVFSLRDLLRHWVNTGMDLNNTPRSMAEMEGITRCK